MKCECGSTKMHCYFHYVSKGIERFRCLECNSCYEVQGDLTVKLEMPSIDKDALQELRHVLGINQAIR